MSLSTASFDIDARTDRGRQRSNNQDSIGRADQWRNALGPLERELRERYGRLYIVADGVGGNADGADASRMVVDLVIGTFYRDTSGTLPEDPEERLRAAIERVTGEIHAEAQRRNNNMASTIVAALVHNERLIIANVGDSPAILVRTGQAPKQLTKAHIRREADGGTSLAQAMGDPQVSASLFSMPFAPGDAVVLCSDGLTDLVQPTEIAEVVERYPSGDATRVLIDMANRRGGHDNISALVVRNGPPPPRRAAGIGGRRMAFLAGGLAVALMLGVLLFFAPQLISGVPQPNVPDAPQRATQVFQLGGGNQQSDPSQPVLSTLNPATATLTPSPIPPTNKPAPRSTSAPAGVSDTATPTLLTATATLTPTEIPTPENPSPTPTPIPTTTPDPSLVIPNLVGKIQAEAEAELQKLGIGYRIEEVTSDDYQVQIGVVAATDPPAGTRLEPQQVVTLMVKAKKDQKEKPTSEAPPPPKP